MHIDINSQFRTGAQVAFLRELSEVSVIKNEPMLFNCSPLGVREVIANDEAPIIRSFMSLLAEVSGWLSEDVVIDSRAHMLMPGWYPCIPGWHHDDVPRERSDGQPQYHRANYRSEHVMMLINSDVCPTQFATGNGIFEEPPLGTVIYEKWHKEVQDRVDAGKLEVHSAPNGQLIFFDDRAWHRGTAAVKNGWRYFIRASRYFDSKTGQRVARGNERTNERRMQAQVYMSSENAGW